MKILYISIPPFFDMDLSIVKHLSNYCEMVYLLDIPPYFRNSTAVKINNAYSQNGIFKSEIYAELSEWWEYIKPEQFYVINRISSKKLSPGNILLQKKITDFISSINPDVIHISSFVDVDYLLPLWRFRKKTVITVHDPMPHSGETSYRNKLIRKMNYSFIKNFIILNQQQLPLFEEITKQYNLQNIFLSSLGIYEYLNLYKKKKVIPQNTNSRFIFLFFGRISPYKGIDILLEAFIRVKQEYENIKLVIAGNGKYWFDISQYQKLEDIEIINRYIANEELVSLVEQSSVVVCPYKDATQSGVVMSAFALNKPVIATQTGGLPEMVIEGKTGYLVKPGDVEELKNKMTYILENRKELKILSENIEQWYRGGEKSWKTICKKIYENYKKM